MRTDNKMAEDEAASDNTLSDGATADDMAVDVKVLTPLCSWLCRYQQTRPGAEENSGMGVGWQRHDGQHRGQVRVVS